MASLTLPLRSGLLPLILAACTFEAAGLGSEGSGAGDGSSLSSDNTTAITTASSSTTIEPTSEPTSTATDSGTTSAATEPTTEPLTTTEPTITGTTGTTDATTTTDPSSTTDVPGVCGDGKVDPGEQCDAGAMNGDDQACTAGCLDNVCGDGKQGPGEGCDDGNQTPDDGCSPECMAESCGDGKKQPEEACDDGNQVDNDGCTNACTLPACGDKIVQMGEQCDDAGESAKCDKDCSNASCGDGTLNAAAGEMCDDNNMTNTDACVACKPAKCGDGFVQANVEACDDGNAVDDDACSNTCKQVSAGLRVFVSSTLHNGNLGGLAGADDKCKTLAAAAKLGGTWMAWLSDDNDGPSQRFTTKGGPQAYVRLDGKVIANNWADLTTKDLLVAIDITEKNQAAGDTTRVWSNTKQDGTPATNRDCMTWGTVNANGSFGRRNLVDPKWTHETDENCDSVKHLYCFEQP